jgi:hypothetical protein
MVKMLVVALGYAPAAADMGGWPTGYLVVASQQGVLENTTNVGAAPATRGVVAQLTFNALTAAMMKQTGYGENKEYTVMDEEGKRETLLTQKLDIYKVAVTPIANDAEAIEDLGVPTEPEYYMTEEQVIDLMKNGSMDAWLDCLDFAPQGVMEMIKSLSVSVPLGDFNKRRALQEKTGFDVDAAIKHMEEEREEKELPKAAPQRRVQPEAEKPARRTTSKYNVVSK